MYPAKRNVGGLHGLFEDQARERGIHLIWIPHDVMDPRTVSAVRCGKPSTNT